MCDRSAVVLLAQHLGADAQDGFPQREEFQSQPTHQQRLAFARARTDREDATARQEEETVERRASPPQEVRRGLAPLREFEFFVQVLRQFLDGVGPAGLDALDVQDLLSSQLVEVDSFFAGSDEVGGGLA